MGRSSRTDVVVSKITSTGIQVELTTDLDVPTLSAAARHALLLDVVRMVEANGLTPGPGMQTLGQGASKIGVLAAVW